MGGLGRGYALDGEDLRRYLAGRGAMVTVVDGSAQKGAREQLAELETILSALRVSGRIFFHPLKVMACASARKRILTTWISGGGNTPNLSRLRNWRVWHTG